MEFEPQNNIEQINTGQIGGTNNEVVNIGVSPIEGANNPNSNQVGDKKDEPILPTNTEKNEPQKNDLKLDEDTVISYLKENRGKIEKLKDLDDFLEYANIDEKDLTKKEQLNFLKQINSIIKNSENPISSLREMVNVFDVDINNEQLHKQSYMLESHPQREQYNDILQSLKTQKDKINYLGTLEKEFDKQFPEYEEVITKKFNEETAEEEDFKEKIDNSLKRNAFLEKGKNIFTKHIEDRKKDFKLPENKFLNEDDIIKKYQSESEKNNLSNQEKKLDFAKKNIQSKQEVEFEGVKFNIKLNEDDIKEISKSLDLKDGKFEGDIKDEVENYIFSKKENRKTLFNLIKKANQTNIQVGEPSRNNYGFGSTGKQQQNNGVTEEIYID